MRLVRKYINEKFSEDSDPIHDMGIGGTLIDIMKLRDEYRKKYNYNEFNSNGREIWWKALSKLLKEKYLYGKFDDKNSKPITIYCNTVTSALFGTYVQIITDTKKYKVLENETYLIKRDINEKFLEDSDPIKDMGIGFYKERDFSDIENLNYWICENLINILELESIPKNIINEKGLFIRQKYRNIIRAFSNTFLTINKKAFALSNYDSYASPRIIHEYLLSKGYKT